MTDIKDYEGLYAITEDGKVYSYRTKKFLKPYYDVSGYEVVDLCVDSKRKSTKVHRLVALTYISNPDNLPCVNHKDEVKTNNHVSNLEWCTSEYNNNYGTRTARQKATACRHKEEIRI